MRAEPRSVRQAARTLRQGGLIAYPTESCFGLGCDPLRRAAVSRLLRLKGRSQAKGLILIAHRARELAAYGSLPAAADATWPGPVTWLIPGTPRARPWLRGRHDQIAVRVPGHEGARAMARAVGAPIVSTSANRSGARAARSAREVRRLFGDKLDAVVAGQIGRRRTPSQIIDAATGRVLR